MATVTEMAVTMATPDRIEIYDGFFEREVLDDIKRLIADVRWKWGWKSSKELPDYVQFNHDFARASAQNREDAKARIDPEVAPALLRAWDVIQEQAIRAPHSLLRCYSNQSVYGIDGYPHRDTTKEFPHDLTCLLYCVQGDWPLEWAGETVLCRDGEIIKSVIPRENRLLLFSSSMVHIARGVARACFDQRVTLMWKSSPLATDEPASAQTAHP